MAGAVPLQRWDAKRTGQDGLALLSMLGFSNLLAALFGGAVPYAAFSGAGTTAVIVIVTAIIAASIIVDAVLSLLCACPVSGARGEVSARRASVIIAVIGDSGKGLPLLQMAIDAGRVTQPVAFLDGGSSGERGRGRLSGKRVAFMAAVITTDVTRRENCGATNGGGSGDAACSGRAIIRILPFRRRASVSGAVIVGPRRGGDRFRSTAAASNGGVMGIITRHG